MNITDALDSMLTRIATVERMAEHELEHALDGSELLLLEVLEEQARLN